MTTEAPRRRRTGFTMAEAIGRALDQALADDDRTMIIGEDVGRLGGVFRLTAGLQEKYGAERVVDSPLAEAGLVGTAVGLALNGMRPVVEIQFDGFIFPALNQICTHVARLPLRMSDEGIVPMTIRMPVGGRIRASELHSESPETYFAHTPDLHVVACSIPETAKALVLAAIRADEPYIVLEPKRLYRRGRVEPENEIADVDPTRARLLSEGTDALLVSYGPLIDVALAAAEEVEREDGVSIGVLDLVSLAPLDHDTILAEATRSGRVVVAGEGIRRCSITSEVISLLATEAFGVLQAAPRAVTAPNRPYPPAHQEDEFLPHAHHITAALREVLA
jgi:2-oxoisovalerate dehydrogenase E1 component beta subunit